jgi:hypothetical protein
VSPSHGDRLPQRKLFAVDHRLQQFRRPPFRGLAFTDRDQHFDRQASIRRSRSCRSRRCPTWASNPARRTDCLLIRHPFCSPESRHTA